MENLKEIVKDSIAKLTHICNGKAYFDIITKSHHYQLEINCMADEWKDVYIKSEYKSISLMRWIRKGIDNNDDTLIQLM